MHSIFVPIASLGFIWLFRRCACHLDLTVNFIARNFLHHSNRLTLLTVLREVIYEDLMHIDF